MQKKRKFKLKTKVMTVKSVKKKGDGELGAWATSFFPKCSKRGHGIRGRDKNKEN